MNTSFEKFVPISKIDEEKRMVYGFASTPDLDSQGEVVEIDAIKNALPEYMKFPTIREMHQPNAVGTTKSTRVSAKGLEIGAKIVDDNAWNKVKEGVLRGFSIGGSVIDKVDNAIKSLFLTEISLVDVPANRKAKITLFKAEEDSYKKTYLKMMGKHSHSFGLGKGVEPLEKAKKKTKDVEVDVETTEEVVETKDVEVAEEVVVETTEETVVEDKPETKVEVDPAKQASDEPTTLEKTEKKLEKMENEHAESLVKIDRLNKVETALFKLTAIVERQQEVIAKFEKLPMAPKTKASFVVGKTIGEIEVKETSGELAKAQARYDELGKIRVRDMKRYEAENMGLEATALLSTIRKLKK